MKLLIRLSLFLVFISVSFCWGQDLKITYDNLIVKDASLKLSSGLNLIVTDIPSPIKADALKITYNKGNKIEGDYSKETSTKKFKIPQGKGEILIQWAEGLEKSVPFGEASPTDEPEPRYTGIAFSDANTIYKILIKNKNIDDPVIVEIIRQYNSCYCKDSTNLFFDFFRQDNTKSAFEKELKSLVAKPTNPGTHHSMGTSPLAAVSGVDVTKYVQAFADFLRDRIKEEITLAYIDKLKKTFEEKKELQYLLPKTYGIFNNGLKVSIPSLGPAYKAAFAEDMENILLNFESMVYKLDEYKQIRTDNRFKAFMISYHFADYSAKGYHPSEILRLLNDKYGYDKLNTSNQTKVNYSISILNMLSQHLKVAADSSKWVSKNEPMLVDRNFMIIFFGLLYEKYPELLTPSGHGSHLYTILQNMLTTNKDKALDKIYNFLILANNIDRRINDFKEMKNGALSAEDKRKQVLSFFLNNADDIGNLIDFSMEISGLASNPDYSDWKKVAKQSVEVAKGIHSNDVGKVAVNSVSLISTVINDSTKLDLIQKLSFYTNFITDMAAADSAQQITKILENYAAPVRSYRINRESNYSFTLATYPGLYFGLERNRNVDGGKLKDNVFGVTAPIGFALTQGTKRSESWSIFLSMVDIGAALSYRSNSETTDIPDKITLGQIFSPGLNLIYGIKGGPLALKLGYQYAPHLRSIETDQNVIQTDADVWRLNFGLSADIPVFIFSNKPKQ